MENWTILPLKLLGLLLITSSLACRISQPEISANDGEPLPLFSATEQGEDASILMPRAPIPKPCVNGSDTTKFCASPYSLYLSKNRYGGLRSQWGERKTSISHLQKLFQSGSSEFLLSVQSGEEPPLVWLAPYSARVFRVFPVLPEISQIQHLAATKTAVRFHPLSDDTAEIEFNGEHLPSLSRIELGWSSDGYFHFRFKKMQKPFFIVLDAGHGGTEVGAVVDGLVESQLNLELVQALAEALLSKGVKVGFTRVADRNVSLYDRMQTARNPGTSLFVSVHHDAGKNAQQDVRPLCIYSRFDMSDLCRAITLSAPSLYPEKLSYTKRYMFVLQGYENPSILLEAFNLSDPQHRLLLKNPASRLKFYKQWAEALSTSILRELELASSK